MTSRDWIRVAIALCTLAPAPSRAWDVRCEDAAGVPCPDGLAAARTTWNPHPRAEHRAMLERTLGLAGLPADFQLPFRLTVFTAGDTLAGGYPTLRPVPVLADRTHERETSVPAMASLPDFSYTLWDWASGNEGCPPDPLNPDPIDCHKYETHIGWLNSNHMLPQGQRFYEHLHRLALERARACRQTFDDVPALHIPRFAPYVRACEKQALVIEAVGQHYLQDAWASGHMWERWGGPEVTDFGGNRGLGFAVATLTGLIHGAKASLDVTPVFSLLAPWDDPLNAPHPDVEYVDGGLGPGTGPLAGVGDVFMPELLGVVPSGFDLTLQRRALFGCAVDGVRGVYGETAQLHGPMTAPNDAEADLARDVDTPACWSQRVTNRALGAGCGIHQGHYPSTNQLALDITPGGFLVLLAETQVAPLVAGAQPLTSPLLDDFRADAAFACSLALALAADPTTADGTDLASGGFPSIAGIEPNSFYARGGTADPTNLPASWADPFLPWNLSETDAALREQKEALNLTFADAHAADRCRDLTEAQLLTFRDAVQLAKDASAGAEVVAARCGQCAQMVTPHLRFGIPVNHDPRREAFCTFVGPAAAAFVYTEENPATFTGGEPTDLGALLVAASTWCGCGTTTTTTTTSSTTTTTLATPTGLWSGRAHLIDPGSDTEVCAGMAVAELPNGTLQLLFKAALMGLTGSAFDTCAAVFEVTAAGSSLSGLMTNHTGACCKGCPGQNRGWENGCQITASIATGTDGLPHLTGSFDTGVDFCSPGFATTTFDLVLGPARCGDCVLDAGEECEPPGMFGCDADCEK